MPPQGASYNVDWIISTTSNAHVANDRAWFSAYMPFRTKIATALGAEPSVDIHGIGTVILPTRTYLGGKPHKPSGQITLHHVLHAPSASVNIYAMQREDLTINFGGGAVTPITKGSSNKVLGLVVCSNLFRLWLKGQSQNQSSLNPNAMHYFHALWPSSEVARFNDHVTDLNRQRELKANQADPLTQEEKQFLAKHYGGEFKFLMTHGLNIHKEEDREEGRRILRAVMAGSEDEAEHSDDDQESIESDDFQAEIERDPASHVADYKFTPDQLDWLKIHYKHSGNSMRCYGLKPWDDDDCDEAISIVKAFIEDED